MLKILPKSAIAALYSILTSTSVVFAHGGEEHQEVATLVENTLEDSIRTNSIKVVVIASIVILGFTALTIFLKHQGENLKKLLFVGIVVPTLIATTFIAGSTIYLNIVSTSGGPVHWHAEFEVWDCGQKLKLAKPEGLSNRVGTAAFHSHEDNWIHLEGVVVEQREASLGKFFEVVGGKITRDNLVFPTNSSLVVRENGDACPDGTKGTLQVFVYQTKNDVFYQKKLSDPSPYIISPYGSVPPGDCLIIEFSSEIKDRTDKLCSQYELQLKKGTITTQTKTKNSSQDPDHTEGDKHPQEEHGH